MLLAGSARLLGVGRAAPTGFVALHATGDLAVVVGPAPAEAIAEAAQTAEEILAAPEDGARVAAILPGWKVETALLHLRPAAAPLPAVPADAVRFLTADELSGSAGLPEALRRELWEEFEAGTPIAAAFEGGRPVSFSYAGSITETKWDVSIDTLEPYRRRGHAQRVVSFLIAHYAKLGREPVWGALLSNPASLALAARLGFEPVDRLAVFRSP